MALERQTITVAEAGQILGCSRALAYEMARQGRIPIIRLGRKLVVPKAALERMLEDAGGKEVHTGLGEQSADQ